MTRAQVRACEVIAGLKSALPRIRRGIKQEILSAEQLRSVRRAARIRSIHRAGEMKRADLRSVSGCGAGGRAALCIRSWGGEGRGGEGAAAALPLPAHLKAVAACSAFLKRGPYRSHRPVMVRG